MDSFRKWFTFSRGERIAVISLLVAILILIVACLLRPSRQSLSDDSLHRLDSLLALHQAAVEQQAADSMEAAELHPFPFNPNTATEDEWRQIGLGERQIRNIMSYKAKGGVFRTKDDLGRLYTISEEDLAQLRPYIELPEKLSGVGQRPAKNQWKDASYPPVEKKSIPIVDLNSVDSITLVELPQIGPYMAMRIIEYRERLGGYLDKEQLREVKGMDSARFATAIPFINIGDDAPLRRLDVNREDFKTLLRHPYLSYGQVKRIFNHREKRGMIKDWTQLEALLNEEGKVNPMLEYYLKY